MYNFLVLSHLNLCVLTWDHSDSCIFLLKNKVVHVQCKIQRAMDPLFKKRKIQKFMTYSTLKFQCRYSKNEILSFFRNIFECRSVTHSYFNPLRRNPIRPILIKTKSKSCIQYYIPRPLQNTSPCILIQNIHTFVPRFFKLH